MSSGDSSIILHGGGSFGYSEIDGTNLDNIDLNDLNNTGGNIVLRSLFQNTINLNTNQSSEHQLKTLSRSLEVTGNQRFIEFTDQTTGMVVGTISIISYNDGSNSIKFIKGVGASSAAIISFRNQCGNTTLTWGETGFTITSNNNNTVSTTNEIMYPITDGTIKLLLTCNGETRVLRIFMERDVELDGGTSTVTQQIDFEDSELINIFDDQGADIEININEGGNILVSSNDSTGSSTTPPTFTQQTTVRGTSLTDGSVITAYIADDAVTNTKLANMTRGTVKVGGASNVPTDFDASGDGYILIGDGTDITSVLVTGDATIANDGTLSLNSDLVIAGRVSTHQDTLSLTSDTIALNLGVTNNIALTLGSVAATTLAPTGYTVGQTGNIVIVNGGAVATTVSFNARWYVAGSDTTSFVVAAGDRALVSYYAATDYNAGSGELYTSTIASFGPTA